MLNEASLRFPGPSQPERRAYKHLAAKTKCFAAMAPPAARVSMLLALALAPRAWLWIAGLRGIGLSFASEVYVCMYIYIQYIHT